MIPDLAAFAPRRVLEHDLTAADAVLSAEATTLFVDLEGFTALTGRLGGFGSRGTEQLSGLLRAFFAAVTDEVTERGGDPIAFGGDALTFVFDAPAGAALDAARSAGEAILEVARDFSGRPTLAGPAVLATRVGIARGVVTTAVARSRERWVPVHVGPGLDLAEAAQSAARAGEIVVHPSAVGAADVVAPAGPVARRSPGDLSRLVSPWVVDRLGSDPESHRRVSAAFVGLPPVGAGEVGEFVGRVGLLLEVVDEWEGEVVQVAGGDKGVVAMVVFGAPLAHADDPLRATESVLRLRERVPAICAGVATGPVFAALLGSRTRVFATHFGLAVATAARLMQAAAPGQLLVDAPTRTEVSGTLRTGRARLLTLKGHAEPVEAHAVEGWRQATATARAASYPPLVGREPEVAAVEQLLERVAAGDGGALTVVGDPGLGKTRLLQEATDRARTRGFTVVATDVDAHPRGRSQPVWRELVGALAGPSPDLERLGRALRPLVGSDTDEAQGVPPTGPDVELDAQLAQGALARLLTDASAQAPVLVAVDNVHGLDDFSGSVLGSLGHLLAGAPVGLLLTTDPSGDVVPDAIHLHELADVDVAQVAADAWRQAGGGTPPPWLAEVVLARAGTTPLFVRAVTEALWESWEVGSPPPVVDPAEEARHALTGLLQERIDRIGRAEREVLDVHAVLGRPCAPALVASVLGERADPVEVAAIVARLTERGLLEVAIGDEGDRHGLPHRFLRDVVHDSLSHAARDRIRREVVEVLAVSDADPVEIAEHVRRLDDDRLKRRWLPLAAASARASWNLPLAAECLDDLRPLVTGAERDLLEVERLEVMLIAGRVSDVLAEAGATTYETGDSSLRTRRLHALAEAAFACGEFERSAVAAREVMGLADTVDEARYQRAAELLVLATCEQGDTQVGIETARTLVARARATGDPRGRTSARAALGAALLIGGRAAEAVPHYRSALDSARTSGDVVQQVHILSDLAGCAYETGDHPECLRLLGEARQLADRVGYRRHLAFNLTNDAQLRAGAGDPFVATCAAAAVDRCVELGDLPVAAKALHTWISTDHSGDATWWRRLAAIDSALGQARAEAEDLASLALAAARGAQPGDALDPAAAAEAIADELGQPQVVRRARLARALTEPDDHALIELDRLASEASEADDVDPVELAEIGMERWRLTGSPDARAEAIDLVTQVFVGQPSLLVRGWLDELDAPQPVEPEALPPPVGIARSDDGDARLSAAFDRVESALAARQRSA